MVDDAPNWDPAQFVYVQVADRLGERIAAGELPPGARLPPEHDLADAYQVSRDTVRRAIEVLQSRGIVRTLHGRGTYVIAPE